MSTSPLSQVPLPKAPEFRQSLGTIVVGIILVLAGFAWILDVLGLVDLSLGVVLPAALILVGVALLAGSLSGSHGGLIALGIILTLVLAGTTAIDVPMSGGIGDHSYVATRTTDLRDSYQLMIGDLHIDLSDLALPAGTTTVTARVGIGQLTIDVPHDVAVQIHWKVSGGNVNALNFTQNGTSLDHHYESSDFSHAKTRLVIDAQMGFGNVDVRQR